MIFMLLLIGMFHSPLALASTVNVEASIDRNQISLEDEIHLTITVEGSRKATDPSLPPIHDFDVIPSGTTSSFQFINGKMSFKKMYSYVLVPQREGKFTIDKVSVFLDGVEYKSNPLVVVVGPSQEQQQQTLSQPIAPSLGNQNQDTLKPYWITTEVNNPSPYLNEQILFTFRFYIATNVNVGALNLELPDFDGFITEEVVQDNKYYTDIQGQRYIVAESVFALFPTKTGPLSLGSTVLTAEVAEPSQNQRNRRSIFDDPFFGMGRVRMVTKRLRTQSIDIRVKQLPQPEPDNFTRLVGLFNLSTRLSDESIKMGESTTLTIHLQGKGNIKDAQLPDSLPLENFKIYSDKPVSELIKKTTGVEGDKTFKKALVPLHAGTLEIPSFSLTYFNPDTERYAQLTTQPMTVHVSQSEDEKLHLAQSNKTNAQTSSLATMTTEDIATLHTNLQLRKNQPFHFSFVAYGLLFFIAPGLFGIFLLIRRLRHYQVSNSSYFKSRSAAREFQITLTKLKKAELRASSINNAIQTYIGNKYSLYGRALTASDICDILSKNNVGAETISQLRNCIKELDMASYGATLSEDALKQILDQCLITVKAIEQGK